MKFDFAIGNPPYQGESKKNGRQPPVYHLFMNGAFSVANCVELITPARFLFNAGQTPKEWNDRMLNDKHFHVLRYEPNASSVFPFNDIKGGVAITVRDINKEFEPIGIFVEGELEDILNKVIDETKQNGNLSDIGVGAVPYKFTNKLKQDYPQSIALLSDSFDLRTNVLVRLKDIAFFEEKKSDKYIGILGLEGTKRYIRYIKNEYVEVASNFKGYKVMVPKANGSGSLGEVLTTPLIGEPLIGEPLIGHTQSFISFGNFKTKSEALALLKYIKTKFARCLLGVLKVTQDNPPEKWKFVPLQDFTSNSDINWNVSVKEIDKQLYKKYDLSPEEVEFIEKNVKEMS